MIKKLFVTSVLGLTCSLTANAGLMGPMPVPLSPFYLGAFGGYGVMEGAYKRDGNVAQGMLTLGFRAGSCRDFLFGLELGLQSGNTMRLEANPDLILAAGGLPIQTTLKPVLDFLVTVKKPLPTQWPLSLLLKGGFAYRQLQFLDRSSSQDNLNKVNGEFQAGLGFAISEHAMLSAFYQGIYSAEHAGFYLDAANDVLMSKIPSQQAGFLGVEYTF